MGYHLCFLNLSKEVKHPGLYSFGEVNQIAFRTSNRSNVNSSELPKVFDSIRLKKGMTNYADLSKIRNIRDNSDSNGGSIISISLNLFSLLQDGNQNVNIKLMDGDLITLPSLEN